MTTAPPPVPVGARGHVDVRGRRLMAWRAGDSGPTVLFVHGMPTNHLLWHDVVPLLHEHARLVSVDMLGYGWSEAPLGARVDVAAQAGHLLDLLDVLGVDQAVVVGHDFGAAVVQILATNAADRVTGVGIIDGVCFDAWPVPPVRAAQLARPLVARLPRLVLAAGVDRAARALFTDRARAARFGPWFAAPWRTPDASARLAEHLRAADPAYTLAVTPFLPRLRMPVEILWGGRDTQLPPPLGERLAAAIPTAHLARAPAAGHFVPAEDPDAVAAAVRRLLDRVP